MARSLRAVSLSSSNARLLRNDLYHAAVVVSRNIKTRCGSFANNGATSRVENGTDFKVVEQLVRFDGLFYFRREGRLLPFLRRLFRIMFWILGFEELVCTAFDRMFYRLLLRHYLNLRLYRFL